RRGVRGQQVRAPALGVDREAEPVARDPGALDVPAGTPGAERAAVPRGLARPLAPPQQRVERVLLALAVGVATALGEQVLHDVARESRHGAEAGVRREAGGHVAEAGVGAARAGLAGA